MVLVITVLTIGGGIAVIRGSKYVQSDLGDCFSRIKSYLTQKRLVCFVGTPCQIEGLKAFLSKDYDNLLTVDLVCHGTPSPKLWIKYLDYQREKYHSNIKSINFRNKTYGYHSGTMKIVFDNGKIYQGSARIDYYLKSFFSEIASRPICYNCPFKTVKHCSDFTIYDCWHPEELSNEIKDDDKGYTNLIIQSEKGKQIFSQIKDKYEAYSVLPNDAIKLDGKMIAHSAIKHPQRSEYYRNIDRLSFPELINKFIPITFTDLLIERMKIVLYKLGVFNIIKKLFKP